MQSFDNVSEGFAARYGTVRGAVSETLTQSTLAEYLPPAPARVLDLGGGDGRDAEWLAMMGYEVAWVDPSHEMHKKAQQRFADTILPVTLYHVEPENVEAVLAPGDFDVVLSHGVLMYCVEDPHAHLRTIANLARPGAVISLLTKGFGGALDRLLKRHRIGDIQELLEKGQMLNSLGKRIQAFRPREVEVMLGNHALNLVDWRGVRVATDEDRRDVKNVKPEALQQILAAEGLLGRDPNTRGLGQMLHYIARKS